MSIPDRKDLKTCGEEDCPGCQLEKLFNHFKDEGADMADIVGLSMAVLGDVFDTNIESAMVQLPVDEDRVVH